MPTRSGDVSHSNQTLATCGIEIHAIVSIGEADLQQGMNNARPGPVVIAFDKQANPPGVIASWVCVIRSTGVPAHPLRSGRRRLGNVPPRNAREDDAGRASFGL